MTSLYNEIQMLIINHKINSNRFIYKGEGFFISILGIERGKYYK